MQQVLLPKNMFSAQQQNKKKKKRAPKKRGQSLNNPPTSYGQVVSFSDPSFSSFKNSSIPKPKKIRNPNSALANRAVTISHSEYLIPIVMGSSQSNGVFHPELQRFRLNPGSDTTFPWLAPIANSFEKYRFKKLQFRYITRAATTTIGSFTVAPDYDAADAAYTSEQQMAAASDSKMFPMWRNFTFPLSPGRMNATYKEHYCMNDTRFNGTAQDPKTIDVGSFQIGGETTVAVSAGKLWVDYEVELFNPQLNTEPQAMSKTLTFTTTNNPAAMLTSVVTEITEPGELLPSNQYPISQFKVYPTNIIGTFIKDWEGIVNTNFFGTGITQLPSLRVNNTNDALKAAPIGSIPTGIINTALNTGTKAWKIRAKEGDYLNFHTDLTATTVTQALLSMANGGWNSLL